VVLPPAPPKPPVEVEAADETPATVEMPRPSMLPPAPERVAAAAPKPDGEEAPKPKDLFGEDSSKT
jgi:hypothetical protein